MEELQSAALTVIWFAILAGGAIGILCLMALGLKLFVKIMDGDNT